MEQETVFNHGLLSKPSKASNTILKRSSRLPQDKNPPNRTPNNLNSCDTTRFQSMYVTTCSTPRTARNPHPEELPAQAQDYGWAEETDSRHRTLAAYFL